MYSMSSKVLRNRMSFFCEIGFFPRVFELLEPVEHPEQAEIHRAHVQRGDLGPVDRRRLHPLGDRHRRRSAGGEVDDATRSLLDHFQKGREGLGVWSGWPVFGIARMQMHDRRACLGGADRRVGDLLRRHRQIRRHGRRVDGAGDSAGDDDLPAHVQSPLSFYGGKIAGASIARSIEVDDLEARPALASDATCARRFITISNACPTISGGEFDRGLDQHQERAARGVERQIPVVDPLGGSYYVEALTSEYEKRIFAILKEVEELAARSS